MNYIMKTKGLTRWELGPPVPSAHGDEAAGAVSWAGVMELGAVTCTAARTPRSVRRDERFMTPQTWLNSRNGRDTSNDGVATLYR